MSRHVKLFYIGDDYYTKSRTIMSPVYEEHSRERSDWGAIGMILLEGGSVEIRQATKEESAWAKAELAKVSK